MTKLVTPAELHRYPVFLPDNKHFLYVVNVGKPETNGINIGSLDGAPPCTFSPTTPLLLTPLAGSNGSGLLLFRRESSLMGVPFDPQRLRITGDVFPVTEGVGTAGNTSNSAFSVSSNGVLVYGNGGLGPKGDEMVWMDRTGKRLGNSASRLKCSGRGFRRTERKYCLASLICRESFRIFGCWTWSEACRPAVRFARGSPRMGSGLRTETPSLFNPTTK